MGGRSSRQLETSTILGRIALLAVVVVVIDRIVGRGVTEWLGPGADRHARWLVGNDVGFEYVRNTGAAFGILQGNPEILGALSIVVCIIFVWLILSEMPRGGWAVLAAGLVVGGATGNLFGRLVDGYVTDYVAVGPWPRFNVADSAITIGVCIFVISLLYGAEPEHHESDGDVVHAGDHVNGEGGA